MLLLFFSMQFLGITAEEIPFAYNSNEVPGVTAHANGTCPAGVKAKTLKRETDIWGSYYNYITDGWVNLNNDDNWIATDLGTLTEGGWLSQNDGSNNYQCESQSCNTDDTNVVYCAANQKYEDITSKDECLKAAERHGGFRSSSDKNKYPPPVIDLDSVGWSINLNYPTNAAESLCFWDSQSPTTGRQYYWSTSHKIKCGGWENLPKYKNAEDPSQGYILGSGVSIQCLCKQTQCSCPPDYKLIIIGTTKGCFQCDPGKVAAPFGVSGTQYSCRCDDGQIEDQDGFCKANCEVGQYNNNGACADCPKGYYADSAGAADCKYCDKEYGQWSDDKASACKICPHGWKRKDATKNYWGSLEDRYLSWDFPAGNQTDVCEKCPAGQWSNIPIYDDDFRAVQTCSVCPAGYEKDPTKTGGPSDVCTACDIGKWSDADSSNCSDCPAGYVKDPTKTGGPSDVCTACDLGKWSDDDSDSCSFCPAGKRRSGMSSRGNETHSCTECTTPGTYAAEDSISCSPCTVGKYDDDKNTATPCLTCPSGWSQPVAGQTSCVTGCQSGQEDRANYGITIAGGDGGAPETTGSFPSMIKIVNCETPISSQLECDVAVQRYVKNVKDAIGMDATNAQRSVLNPRNYTGVISGTITTYPAPDYNNGSCPVSDSTGGAICTTHGPKNVCRDFKFYKHNGGNSGGSFMHKYWPWTSEKQIYLDIYPWNNNCNNLPKQTCALEIQNNEIVGARFGYIVCGEKYDTNKQVHCLCEVNRACTDCAMGQFNTGNTGSCDKCDTGRFSTETGATSAETCKNCTAGRFQNAEGMASCEACPLGKYQAADGAATCIECDAGQFSELTNSIGCTACPLGRSQNATGNSACIACVTGRFADVAGSTNCKACVTGKFAAGTGTTNDCENCPIGYISAEGSSNCQVCPAGKKESSHYECKDCSNGQYSIAGQDSCSASCPGGYSSIVGQTSCDECQAGQYATAGSSSCTTCAVGKWQDASGQSSCKACPGGYTSVEGAGQCVQCQAGFFVSGLGACKECDAGKYSTGHVSECTQCPKGWYQHSKQGTQCFECTGGKYAPATGSSTCTVCYAGKYSSALRATSADTCTVCDAGTFAGAGFSRCVYCPAGKYQSEGGASACAECAAGKYTTIVGLTTNGCQDCPVGKWQDASGKGECKACVSGKYSSELGATTDESCKECDAGKYSLTDKCGTCGAGKYVLPFEMRTSGTCYKYINLNTTCRDAIVGLGLWGRASQRDLTITELAYNYGVFNNDRVLSRGCVSVSANAPLFNPNSTSTETCRSDSRCICEIEHATCKNCPEGYYQTGNNQNKCEACPRGKYTLHSSAKTQDDCQWCPKGKYASGNAGTESVACAECPFGQTSDLSKHGEMFWQITTGSIERFFFNGCYIDHCINERFEGECSGGGTCQDVMFKYGSLSPAFMTNDPSTGFENMNNAPANQQTVTDSSTIPEYVRRCDCGNSTANTKFYGGYDQPCPPITKEGQSACINWKRESPGGSNWKIVDSCLWENGECVHNCVSAWAEGWSVGYNCFEQMFNPWRDTSYLGWQGCLPYNYDYRLDNSAGNIDSVAGQYGVGSINLASSAPTIFSENRTYTKYDLTRKNGLWKNIATPFYRQNYKTCDTTSGYLQGRDSSFSFYQNIETPQDCVKALRELTEFDYHNGYNVADGVEIIYSDYYPSGCYLDGEKPVAAHYIPGNFALGGGYRLIFNTNKHSAGHCGIQPFREDSIFKGWYSLGKKTYGTGAADIYRTVEQDVSNFGSFCLCELASKTRQTCADGTTDCCGGSPCASPKHCITTVQKYNRQLGQNTKQTCREYAACSSTNGQTATTTTCSCGDRTCESGQFCRVVGHKGTCNIVSAINSISYTLEPRQCNALENTFKIRTLEDCFAAIRSFDDGALNSSKWYYTDVSEKYKNWDVADIEAGGHWSKKANLINPSTDIRRKDDIKKLGQSGFGCYVSKDKNGKAQVNFDYDTDVPQNGNCFASDDDINMRMDGLDADDNAISTLDNTGWIYDETNEGYFNTFHNEYTSGEEEKIKSYRQISRHTARGRSQYCICAVADETHRCEDGFNDKTCVCDDEICTQNTGLYCTKRNGQSKRTCHKEQQSNYVFSGYECDTSKNLYPITNALECKSIIDNNNQTLFLGDLGVVNVTDEYHGKKACKIRNFDTAVVRTSLDEVGTGYDYVRREMRYPFPTELKTAHQKIDNGELGEEYGNEGLKSGYNYNDGTYSNPPSYTDIHVCQYTTDECDSSNTNNCYCSPHNGFVTSSASTFISNSGNVVDMKVNGNWRVVLKDDGNVAIYNVEGALNITLTDNKCEYKSIDLYNDTIVIGAPSCDKVRVYDASSTSDVILTPQNSTEDLTRYQRQSGTDSAWMPLNTVPTTVSDINFGWSVAISADYVVVGAPDNSPERLRERPSDSDARTWAEKWGLNSRTYSEIERNDLRPFNPRVYIFKRSDLNSPAQILKESCNNYAGTDSTKNYCNECKDWSDAIYRNSDYEFSTACWEQINKGAVNEEWRQKWKQRTSVDNYPSFRTYTEYTTYDRNAYLDDSPYSSDYTYYTGRMGTWWQRDYRGGIARAKSPKQNIENMWINQFGPELNNPRYSWNGHCQVGDTYREVWNDETVGKSFKLDRNDRGQFGGYVSGVKDNHDVFWAESKNTLRYQGNFICCTAETATCKRNDPIDVLFEVRKKECDPRTCPNDLATLGGDSNLFYRGEDKTDLYGYKYCADCMNEVIDIQLSWDLTEKGLLDTWQAYERVPKGYTNCEDEVNENWENVTTLTKKNALLWRDFNNPPFRKEDFDAFAGSDNILNSTELELLKNNVTSTGYVGYYKDTSKYSDILPCLPGKTVFNGCMQPIKFKDGQSFFLSAKGFPDITASDGVCNYDAVSWFKNIEFGSSVALDGNKLAVGSLKNTKLYEITTNADSINIQEEHTFASAGADDVDIKGNYVADSNGLYSKIGANDWQTKLTFTADKVSLSTEHFAVSFADETTDVYELATVKRIVREPLDGIYNSETHGRSEISHGISPSNPVKFNGSLTVVHNKDAWSIQNTSVEKRTLGYGSGQQKYAIACQKNDTCSHGQCVEQEKCSNLDASVPNSKSCVCGILQVKFGDDSNEYYRGNKCQAGDYCYEETKTCSDVPKCTSSLVNDRCLCGIDICNSREYCDLQSGLCHKDGAGLQQCAYTSGKIENNGHLCKCGNSVCFKNPLNITSSDNYYGMYCQKDAHTCSPNPRDDKQFILNQIYVENTEILSQKMCMHAIENLDAKFPTFQIKDRFAVYIANLRTLPVGCFYDQQEEVMWLNTMSYDHSERAAVVSADGGRIEPIYKSTWPNPDNVHCPKPWRCVFIDRDTMNIKSMTWSCKLPDGTSSETCDRQHHLGCFNGKCMPIRNCKTGLNTETCYCGTETCYKNNNNQWITPSSYVNTNEDSLWCSMNQGVGSCSKNKPDTSDKYLWSHVPFSQQDYVSLDDISVGNITLKEDCEAFANKKSYAFTNSTEGPAGCSIQLKKIIQGSEFVYYKTRPPLTVQFNSNRSSTTECKTSLKNHSDINWVEEIDRVCVHKALSECGDDSVKSPCKCEAIDIWKTNICKVGEYCNNGECSAKKCLTTSPTQSKYTAFMSEQLLGTCTCGQKTCNIDENGTFACKQGECALLECPESNTDKQNQLTHRCTCGTNTCAPRQFCEKTTQSVKKNCSSWWCTSSTYIIREQLYTCKNYLSVPGLNLTGADLAGVNLAGVNWTGTDLTGANLTGANLTGADLTGAILIGADLTGADLTNTFSKGLVGIPAKLPDYWFIMKGFLVSTTTTPNNSQLSEMFNDGVGDYIESILWQEFYTYTRKTCTINQTEFASFDAFCSVGQSPVIDDVQPLFLPDGWFLIRIGQNTHILGSGGNYYSSSDSLTAAKPVLISLQNKLDKENAFAWSLAKQYVYTLEDCEYIKNKNANLADKQIYSLKTINVTGCFYNTLYNVVYFNEGSPSDMELDINVTKYPNITRLDLNS